MKWKFLFLIIVILPLVNAVSLQRHLYTYEETLIAKINISKPFPIDESSVKLIDEYGFERTVALNLVAINKTLYYCYFDLIKTLPEANYSLQVTYSYEENGRIVYKTDKDYFLLKKLTKPIISVYPGAAYLKDKDYIYLEIKNHGQGTNVTIHANNAFIDKNSFFLDTGQRELVYVKVSNPGLNFINVSYDNETYEIVVYLALNLTKEREENVTLPQEKSEEKPAVQPTTPKDALQFIEVQKSASLEIKQNKSLSAYLRFKNFWNENLTNVNVEISENLKNLVFINFSPIQILEPGSINGFEVVVNTTNAQPGNYSGTIIISCDEGARDYYNLTICVIGEEIPAVSNETTPLIPQEELMQEEEAKPKKGPIIAIFVIILVLGIGAFLYFKLKKTKIKKSLF